MWREGMDKKVVQGDNFQTEIYKINSLPYMIFKYQH